MVSTTCHKDINRNIIQIHTYFSRSGENNVSYLYLTPSNYCWALLMVSFNFVYWQWRVMSSKQQFSKESRAQFNKPISFLTYKLNWDILQASEGEGSWTYISTGEDSDIKYVKEKSRWFCKEGFKMIVPDLVNSLSPLPLPGLVPKPPWRKTLLKMLWRLSASGALRSGETTKREGTCFSIVNRL